MSEAPKNDSTDLSEARYQELKRVMLEKLKSRTKTAILAVIVESLGDHEIAVLSGLGIDGRTILLDCLIEEATKLREEFKNG